MNWYPFRGIDGVKNANLDAAVNLDIKRWQMQYSDSIQQKHIAMPVSVLRRAKKVLFEEKVTINPGKPYSNPR